MYKKLSAPIMVQWETTPLCNHNCIHCYNYWRETSFLEKLPNNYQTEYQHIVEEIVGNKIFSVVITGGEPLIVIREIAPHIKYLVDNDVVVTMNSNLALMTRDIAAIVKDLGIKSILVSLPSIDKNINNSITGSQGSLEKIINGIKIALEFGFIVSVNMVVSKKNFNSVMETAEFVSTLGIKNFCATRASDPSSNCEFSQYLLDINEFRQLELILKEAKEKFRLNTDSLEANPVCSFGDFKPDHSYRFCCAGKSTCTIGSNGEIRPCNRSTMVYGNISEGLIPCWDSMDDWRSEKWIPIECSDCKLKYLCGGGCKADAVKTYCDISKPDPLCDLNYIQTKGIAKELIKTKEQFFHINPKIKIREEEFGGVIFASTKKWLPVDGNLYRLIASRKEEISITDICNALQIISDDAITIASVLISKQILLERRKTS